MISLNRIGSLPHQPVCAATVQESQKSGFSLRRPRTQS
jgi:hypothetical protein